MCRDEKRIETDDKRLANAATGITPRGSGESFADLLDERVIDGRMGGRVAAWYPLDRHVVQLLAEQVGAQHLDDRRVQRAMLVAVRLADHDGHAPCLALDAHGVPLT